VETDSQTKQLELISNPLLAQQLQMEKDEGILKDGLPGLKAGRKTIFMRNNNQEDSDGDMNHEV